MLPRVQRLTRGGRVYLYHRPTRIRLPDLPETHPDFVSAWLAAEAQGAPRPAAPAQGTVAAAVLAARAGQGWRGLSPVYRATLTRHLEAITGAAGALRMAGLAPEHVEADLDRLAPNVANDRLKAWRWLCGHARRAGTIKADPSRSVGRRQIKTAGYPAWTEAEIAAFRAVYPAGTVARLCLEVVFWTALRTVDAVGIGPLNVGRDGVLTWRQSKTGGATYIPWTAPLPAYAAGWDGERQGMLACLRGDGHTFLAANGRPRSVKGLGNVIAEAAHGIGIARSAHGLRKTRLTMLAEAGATAHAIMAWGGHKSLAEAERYTRAAQLKQLVTTREQTGRKVKLSHMTVKLKPSG